MLTATLLAGIVSGGLAPPNPASIVNGKGLEMNANKQSEQLDISGKIGQLGEKECEWPMYSYDRPAYVLWNAVARGLQKRGWLETEIKEWLQSKEPRWALDGDLGDQIRSLGTVWALQARKVS